MPEATELHAFDVAGLSDRGPARADNEDHCGFIVESAGCVVVAVADGVSGSRAGQTASQTAVEVTLRAFAEQPVKLGAARRLYRAVQEANIAVHDLALVVPELCGMATTLTAAVIDSGNLAAMHVGDSRLYRVRGPAITQLTKDHTVTAERVRLGVLSKERARHHPERSTLTRTLGRELIASIDQLSARLETGDVILVCSDGLYNILADEDIAEIVRAHDASGACRALVDAANARGAVDNVTAAVVRMTGTIPAARPSGLVHKLRRIFV